MWIADIDNLQNYLDILIKKETDRDEFLTFDPDLMGISSNNSVVNLIPALRNTTVSNSCRWSCKSIKCQLFGASLFQSFCSNIQHPIPSPIDQKLCVQY